MKILKHSQDAREALKRGVDLAAKCTNPTLGPAGKGQLIGRMDLPPRIVDDAVSILMNLELPDETEQAAVMLMREVLMTQSKNIKDSTATTMNLSQAVVSELFEKLNNRDSLVEGSVNTISLNKKLQESLEVIISKLRSRARDLTPEDIYSVALSAGSYDWIAKLVTEIYEKIGKDGYVSIEEANKTSYEILSGMDVNAGYHSDYYINNDERQCVLEKPFVFVTNQKLEPEALRKVIGALIQKGKEDSLTYKSVIFIAPDFTPEALASMIKTQTNGDFTPVALKLPTFDKDDILLDIATVTEAKLMDKKMYTSYEQFLNDITIDKLGRLDKAIIGEGKSKFIGGKGDVVSRVKDIKDLSDKSESAFDKDTYTKRIASLNGAVAYIKVGGVSDFDKGYYKLKVENAVGSVQNAFNGGVIHGGGVTLNKIADEIKGQLLSEAIRSPYKTIQANNGEPFEVPLTVIDPVDNIIGALRGACETAGKLLLVESSNVFKNKPEKSDDR